MRKLNLDEVREKQLAILREVAGFCDKNNITYFLCAGTMLGAIRHKGYIPWDDDIDVMLPRPDYERLVHEFESEYLKLYEYRLTPEYNKTFAKMSYPGTKARGIGINGYELGVNIDLFPIDGAPSEDKQLKRHLSSLWWLRKLLSIRHERIFKKHSGIKALGLFAFKMIACSISEKYLLKKINEIAFRYPFGSSSKAGIVVHGYGIKEICPQSVFTESIKVEFGGYLFKGHKDYDTYLTTVYGDYMKLPPEEDRKRHSIMYETTIKI